MSEFKEMLSVVLTVLIIVLGITSCGLIERQQRADVLKACFEQVEDMSECVWFDRNY